MLETENQNQINELKKQLEEAKNELEVYRQPQSAITINSQDKFIETLFEKGGTIFSHYTQIVAETQKHRIDRSAEFEKEELKMINKLDSKEKIYKGVLIAICILSLLIAAFFIEKAEVIIPVLSLIIGLLFKSNALSEYYSKGKND